MPSIVYLISIILFALYFTWVWNGSKEFENYAMRISFIIIGTMLVTLITYIIFMFSKIGIEYPKKEIIKEMRNMILLIFVPLNGFATIPQVINLMNRIKNGNISQEKREKKSRRLAIIILVLIIFECIYFKNIQNGIINYLNLKQ